VTGPRTLIAATLGLLVLAVAFAGAFAATGDAPYLALMVAAGLAACCTADPIKQLRSEVAS
jgi:hypothetical protein